VTGKCWVINASPLILLGKLRRLDIVEALASSVVVPESVLREVSAGLRKDEAGSATLDWASARQVADVPLPVSIASWDLGPGESQVIAHCLAGAQVPVLDDGEARACALAHSLPLIGTLGIILRAKKGGLIPAARPLADQIRAAGSFLDDELVEQALALVGE